MYSPLYNINRLFSIIFSSIGAKFEIQYLFLPRPLNIFVNFDPSLVHHCLTDRNKNIEEIQTARPTIFATVKELFIDFIHYRETTQYSEMKSAIKISTKTEKKKMGSYWCQNDDDIDEYFSILIDAYDTIKSEGYKTQLELSKTKPNSINKKDDEIKLYVDSESRLILAFGGTHRLLISQLLKIHSIPGLIIDVDEEFARKCYNKYSCFSIRDSIIKSIEEDNILGTKIFPL